MRIEREDYHGGLISFDYKECGGTRFYIVFNVPKSKMAYRFGEANIGPGIHCMRVL